MEEAKNLSTLLHLFSNFLGLQNQSCLFSVCGLQWRPRREITMPRGLGNANRELIDAIFGLVIEERQDDERKLAAIH